MQALLQLPYRLHRTGAFPRVKKVELWIPSKPTSAGDLMLKMEATPPPLHANALRIPATLSKFMSTPFTAYRRHCLLTTHLCSSNTHPLKFRLLSGTPSWKPSRPRKISAAVGGEVPSPQLDLTEDNIRLVLADAKIELAQLFDTSVGITGEVELVELDGPFVKVSLRGRFWHKRSTVLARVGNYMKQRIPEILEVDIEDERMLDDSPENF